ncbi:hypothetical protein GJ496_002154 [Pomphorhynchus laevis]|nr:hypothetical protein GJ496_002154 [Pomphorhynchus laevis]
MGKDGELRSTRTVIEEGPTNEGHINVGPEYQAVIPDCSPSSDFEDIEREVLVWKPRVYNEKELDDYIKFARHDYGYSEEQSLALLVWHCWDIDKAKLDFQYYESMQGDSNQYACGLPATNNSLADCFWCVEDCALFEQSLMSHGKEFNRISRVLQDKSVKQVIQHYYTWKRFRSLVSCIGASVSDDPQVRRNFEQIPNVPCCMQCELPCLEMVTCPKKKICTNCERKTTERKRWTRRLPDGIYFDVTEFENLIGNKQVSRASDRILKADWISTLTAFQELKQRKNKANNEDVVVVEE